jgi:DNA-binding NarL/FixJ family response regulator
MPDELQPETIPVMLVDDHAIWRGGVKSMLTGTRFEVVAEASSGKEALEVVKECQPRLVLLDIRMAGGDGLDTLQILKKDYPSMAVVMLTTYDNPTYMARAVAGGASGYLLKGMDRSEMLESLEKVINGEMLLSKEALTRSLRGISSDGADSGELIKPLTDREVEVLKLMATGLNNRELGAILFISEGTVKTHVEHIIMKLGVSDRVQAAVWAARNRIANPQDLPNHSTSEYLS